MVLVGRHVQLDRSVSLVSVNTLVPPDRLHVINNVLIPTATATTVAHVARSVLVDRSVQAVAVRVLALSRCVTILVWIRRQIAPTVAPVGRRALLGRLVWLVSANTPVPTGKQRVVACVSMYKQIV